MQITEIRETVTAEQAAQLVPIFRDAFNTPPSANFLERLNEKSDLSVLLAHDKDTLIGFKIGYTRFKGIFFSWLGATALSHRRSGVARQLAQRQHEFCLDRGYDEIQTESAGTNQAMLILNLQEGFEVSGMHLGHGDALTVQLRKHLHRNKS